MLAIEQTQSKEREKERKEEEDNTFPNRNWKIEKTLEEPR